MLRVTANYCWTTVIVAHIRKYTYLPTYHMSSGCLKIDKNVGISQKCGHLHKDESVILCHTNKNVVSAYQQKWGHLLTDKVWSSTHWQKCGYPHHPFSVFSLDFGNYRFCKVHWPGQGLDFLQLTSLPSEPLQATQLRSLCSFKNILLLNNISLKKFCSLSFFHL